MLNILFYKHFETFLKQLTWENYLLSKLSNAVVYYKSRKKCDRTKKNKNPRVFYQKASIFFKDSVFQLFRFIWLICLIPKLINIYASVSNECKTIK